MIGKFQETKTPLDLFLFGGGLCPSFIVPRYIGKIATK